MTVAKGVTEGVTKVGRITIRRAGAVASRGGAKWAQEFRYGKSIRRCAGVYYLTKGSFFLIDIPTPFYVCNESRKHPPCLTNLLEINVISLRLSLTKRGRNETVTLC